MWLTLTQVLIRSYKTRTENVHSLTQAGICEDRLEIALESEAASIWSSVTSTDTQLAMAGTGARWMVIDLGGM